MQQLIMESGNSSSINIPVFNGSNVLQSGIEITIPSVLWFRAYRSIDFPTVTNDKDYFFLWGTDHSTQSGGQIWWGKGNNLDCSDFQELGLIIQGNQSETPFALSVPNDADGDVFYLYYHVNVSSGILGQHTRLMTCSGGLLHNTTWTQRGEPLGSVTGENHTGYFWVKKHPVDIYRGVHLTVGGFSAEYKFSTATNPRVFARGATYNLTQGIQTGFEVKASHGEYFELYGQNWFIGTIEPFSSIVSSIDKSLIIAKTDSNWQITEQLVELNTNSRNYMALIVGSVAYVYYTIQDDKVWYDSVNLTFLQNYI